MTYTIAFLRDGNYQVRLQDDGLPLHLGTYEEMDVMLWCGYPEKAQARLARVVLWTPHIPLLAPNTMSVTI